MKIPSSLVDETLATLRKELEKIAPIDEEAWKELEDLMNEMVPVPDKRPE